MCEECLILLLITSKGSLQKYYKIVLDYSITPEKILQGA